MTRRHAGASLLLLALLTCGSATGAQTAPAAAADRGPFKLPWTSDDLLSLTAPGGVGQSPLLKFASWTSPGLDAAELDAILDEVGLPRTDAARIELRVLWEAHRARMSELHAATARAMWSTAEQMGPEWERDPWSAATMAMSASQGRRMAEAQLASIDDVRDLLAEVVARVPPERAALAEFVAARTVDQMLREDGLVPRHRAGGAMADLAKLLSRVNGELDAAQRAQVQSVLRRFYEEAGALRRELIREGSRTGAASFYIRVPDEERLREVRRMLRSPGTGQQLGAIREAIRRALDGLEAIIGPEAGARLRTLVDAESSPPPGTPAAAFPDPEQGELACRLLAIEPPALTAEQVDLLNVIKETVCGELRAVNAELRSNEWDEAMIQATWAEEPQKRAELLERRRTLLSERARLNVELRSLLDVALGDAAHQVLRRRLN